VFSTKNDVQTSDNDKFVKTGTSASNSEARKLSMKNNEEGPSCLVSNGKQVVPDDSVIPEKLDTKLSVALVIPGNSSDSASINESRQLEKQSEESRFSCLTSSYDVVSDADTSARSLNRSTMKYHEMCSPIWPLSPHSAGTQGNYVNLINAL